MTDTQHPITPPPELYQKWCSCGNVTEALNQAARWGADQELEACCEWFKEFYKHESWAENDLKHFQDSRRSKPQTLKRMTNLSPATHAVLDALKKASWDWASNEQASPRDIAAAALRALADQVVPANGSRKNNEIRSEILAIAAELEGGR